MAGAEIRLLFFIDAASASFRRFVQAYGGDFAKRDGVWTFAGGMSTTRMSDLLAEDISREIEECSRPFDPVSPSYLFVIGGCEPGNSLLLKKARPGELPAGVNARIHADDCAKYSVAEAGIEMDPGALNSALDRAFDSMFSVAGRKRAFGGKSNVFMLRHGSLDCHALFKIMKYLYGAGNCVNMGTARYGLAVRCLRSANDEIAEYVPRSRLNRSAAFKAAVEEVRAYADACMAECQAAYARGK